MTSRGAVIAEFEAREPVLQAAADLRAAGFDALLAYAPYDLPELSEMLRIPRTALPALTLLAGLAGAAFGYGLQWYTVAHDYVLDVGGRPPHAVPAFVPITFESAVLFAAVFGCIGLCALLRFPRYWDPISEIDGFERSTVDRFWIGVSRRDPHFDAGRIASTLAASGAVRVVDLEVAS